MRYLVVGRKFNRNLGSIWKMENEIWLINSMFFFMFFFAFDIERFDPLNFAMQPSQSLAFYILFLVLDDASLGEDYSAERMRLGTASAVAAVYIFYIRRQTFVRGLRIIERVHVVTSRGGSVCESTKLHSPPAKTFAHQWHQIANLALRAGPRDSGRKKGWKKKTKRIYSSGCEAGTRWWTTRSSQHQCPRKRKSERENKRKTIRGPLAILLIRIATVTSLEPSTNLLILLLTFSRVKAFDCASRLIISSN